MWVWGVVAASSILLLTMMLVAALDDRERKRILREIRSRGRKINLK